MAKPDIYFVKYSEQEVLNKVFDDEKKTLAVSVEDQQLPTGSATSAKQLPDNHQVTVSNQTTLEALVETLQELSQRLAPLGGAISPTAQIRAIVTGAVTATGGGYITSAQHVTNTLTQTNTLRVAPEQTVPILANINNCIGA